MEGLWRVSVVAGLMACCACALVTAGCGDSNSDAAPVTAVATDNPAVAFAPLVRLHPDEEYFPIAANRFIQRATLKWRNGPCYSLDDIATGHFADRKTATPVPRLHASGLGDDRAPYSHRKRDRSCDGRTGRAYLSTERTRPYDDGPRPAGLAKSEGFYLDILSDSIDGDPRFERRGSARFLGDADAYYEHEAVTVDGRPGLRVTYWLLYAADVARDRKGEPLASHEGDWERIQVLLRRSGERRWLPVAVRYGSGDGELRERPWGDLERSGNHPVVYSANGSHASHVAPGVYRRRVRINEDDTGTAHDETASCDDCVSWPTWARLRPLRKEPWYGFGGGWGLGVQVSETSGPLGPQPPN